MTLLRRVGATLFSLLLLQLTLLGSGSLCAMHDAASSQRTSPSHGAHSAGPAVLGAADADMQQHAAHGGCDGSPPGKGTSCELPWAPGVCASMMTCAVTAAPAATLIAQGPVLRTASDLPQPASIHSSTSAAPELPPPRV